MLSFTGIKHFDQYLIQSNLDFKIFHPYSSLNDESPLFIFNLMTIYSSKPTIHPYIEGLLSIILSIQSDFLFLLINFLVHLCAFSLIFGFFPHIDF